MQRLLLSVALAAGLSCSKSPWEPNNDLGLYVWGEVSPDVVSVADTSASFLVTINVYNPSNHDIEVALDPPHTSPNDPSKSHGLWNSIRIARDTNTLSAGPGTDTYFDGSYAFDRHSTSSDTIRILMKQWKSSGWPLTIGTYRVRVWLNGREGEGADLDLVP